MASVLQEKEERKDPESRLLQAIQLDDVDLLHDLIKKEPDLLDCVSKDSFAHTPLHKAAAFGKTKVAMEMAILMPSFTQKLNSDGYSPMHLALQNRKYSTVRALMTFNPKLVRVRGKRGITPLHYVVEIKEDDALELLTEFLSTCKSSIEDLTSHCETAVHVAVKNHNLQAFKVLFGWLMQVNRADILNRKDLDGNTFSQIARSKGLHEIISIQNELEKCAITTVEKCANFFRVQNEATRDVILVVSTLIVAATYQAVLTPPGGYWQDSSSNPMVGAANASSIALGKPHQAGDIILSGWRLYLYFICNSMAFFNSIATILATTLPLEATSIIYISIPFLCTAYFISLSIQIPVSNTAAVISVGVLFEFSLLAVLCLLLYMKIKHRGVHTIDFTEVRIDSTEPEVRIDSTERSIPVSVSVGD